MKFVYSVFTVLSLASSAFAGGDSDPCERIRIAALPIIADYYNEVNSYMAECEADFITLQQEGGPLYPKNVEDKKIECINTITGIQFSTLLDDLQGALQFASITAETVYSEMFGGNEESLNCIKDELENVLTVLGDKQGELASEAALHSQ